jgi:uncharacterized membrane protein
MASDGADSNPAAKLAGLQRDNRPNKSDVHSETGSIVLNAPVTDVYGHCCRFEQLPRFIKSLHEGAINESTVRGNCEHTLREFANPLWAHWLI